MMASNSERECNSERSLVMRQLETGHVDLNMAEPILSPSHQSSVPKNVVNRRMVLTLEALLVRLGDRLSLSLWFLIRVVKVSVDLLSFTAIFDRFHYQGHQRSHIFSTYLCDISQNLFLMVRYPARLYSMPDGGMAT